MLITISLQAPSRDSQFSKKNMLAGWQEYVRQVEAADGSAGARRRTRSAFAEVCAQADYAAREAVADAAAAEAAEKIHKDTKMMLERAESQADYHSTAATAARDVSSPSPHDWLFHRIRNWL